MLHLPPTFLHHHPHMVRTPNLVSVPGGQQEGEAEGDEGVAATEAGQTPGASQKILRAMHSTPRQGAHRRHADISTPAIASRGMERCAYQQATTPTTTCDQQCVADAQTAKFYLV